MSPSREEEAAREVYARFGLAYYMSECVHRGLVHVFAFRPDLDPGAMTRPRVEERMRVGAGKTLGDLMAETLPLLPQGLRADLDWTLATRNFLAHGFWFERIHQMSNASGQTALADELSEIVDRMRVLSAALDALTFQHLLAAGMGPGDVDAAMEHSRQNPPEPLPAREVPRANEYVQIATAWLTDAGALVLQGGDKLLWQLCDGGLGWCYLEGPAATWRPAPALDGLLPAGIIGRPKNVKAWDFKLHVSTGALLVVRPDAAARFRWFVKRTTAAQ